MERGIVINSDFTFNGEALYFPRSGVEPTSLRHYLLYFDKIEYPTNNMIYVESTPDEHFLINEGLLFRTNIKFSRIRGNVGFVMLYMQIEAFNIRNQREPGQWSLAQAVEHLLIPKEYAVEERTIEVELYRALPVPGENVSLYDILQFKEKRHPELLAFRAIMDELYLGIVDSHDIPRAKTASLLRLEKAIQDLNVVSKESFTSRLISSMKVELNLPSLATQALAGAGLATAFEVSPFLGAAIGAVGAALKFEFKRIPKLKDLPNNLKDYAYLHHIERELRT